MSAKCLLPHIRWTYSSLRVLKFFAIFVALRHIFHECEFLPRVTLNWSSAQMVFFRPIPGVISRTSNDTRVCCISWIRRAYVPYKVHVRLQNIVLRKPLVAFPAFVGHESNIQPGSSKSGVDLLESSIVLNKVVVWDSPICNKVNLLNIL